MKTFVGTLRANKDAYGQLHVIGLTGGIGCGKSTSARLLGQVCRVENGGELSCEGNGFTQHAFLATLLAQEHMEARGTTLLLWFFGPRKGGSRVTDRLLLWPKLGECTPIWCTVLQPRV